MKQKTNPTGIKEYSEARVREWQTDAKGAGMVIQDYRLYYRAKMTLYAVLFMCLALYLVMGVIVGYVWGQAQASANTWQIIDNLVRYAP